MSTSTEETNKRRARRTSDATTKSEKTESDLIETNYEEEHITHHMSHIDEEKSAVPVTVPSNHVDPSHPGYIEYINRIFQKS